MALVKCPECDKDLAEDAALCPHCGKPNKKAQYRKRSNVQGSGCLMLFLGLGLFLLSPFLGGVMAIVGLVILLIGFVV